MSTRRCLRIVSAPNVLGSTSRPIRYYQRSGLLDKLKARFPDIALVTNKDCECFLVQCGLEWSYIKTESFRLRRKAYSSSGSSPDLRETTLAGVSRRPGRPTIPLRNCDLFIVMPCGWTSLPKTVPNEKISSSALGCHGLCAHANKTVHLLAWTFFHSHEALACSRYVRLSLHHRYASQA